MSRKGTIDFLLNPGPSQPTLPPQPDSEKRTSSVKKVDVKVPLHKLVVSDVQRADIEDIYNRKCTDQAQTVTRIAWAPEISSQKAAQEHLQKHGLDLGSVGNLDSKWKVMWSTTWGKTHRILLQCNCGYDSNARRSNHIAQSKRKNKTVEKEAGQMAPFDFHHCLGHADITYTKNIDATHTLERLIGILDHTEGCRSAMLTRIPKIPIHPHVIEVAIAQLREGASITAIQIKNKRLLERRAYRDQRSVDRMQANTRYEILQTDFSAIYRTFHRVVNQIDISAEPQVNLDNWLSPAHPNFNQLIKESIFYYVPRLSTMDRLKVCISRPEMDEAAWALANDGQIILDGTFGVCTTRLLLFIVMGIDKRGHGVPLALFLFSAPTGSRATHAGYNTKILAELLQQWRDHLERQKKRPFVPRVAITDTDTKERAALTQVWPAMHLLLCRFHIRQCWTNKRKSLVSKVAGSSTSADSNGAGSHEFWKSQALSRLHDLEKALLSTTDHGTATALIGSERAYYTNLSGTNADAKKVASGVLSYLDYLTATWMSKPLWESWSQFGRNTAAALLGCPVSEVPTTSNHVEAFNGVLKTKYIPQWQRAGRRIRFDVFIHHLILKILPEIFAHRRMMAAYGDWVGERFKLAPREPQVPDRQQEKAVEGTSDDSLLAWFAEDDERELRGTQLYNAGMLMQIQNGRPYEVWATCAASKSNPNDPTHPRYWMTAHPSGSATCTCKDWLRAGGACKHLRALRHAIRQPKWAFAPPVFTFNFPTSHENAVRVRDRNKSWYGAHLIYYVTPSSNAITVAGYGAPEPPSTMLQVSDTVGSVNTPLPPPGHSGSELIDAEVELVEAVLPEDHGDASAGETTGGPEGEGSEEILDSSDSGPTELTAVNTPDQGQTRSAITAQLDSRFAHTIERAIPMLTEVTSLLETYASIGRAPREGPELDDFDNALKELVSAMSNSTALVTGMPETSPGLHGERTNCPRPSTPSLKRSQLLPPSPETKQKRKRSHGAY